MPSARTETSESAALGELVVLEDERSQSRAVIAPARGAIVTSFEVGGRELLFMDASTLRDPAKNVRGGIPVLFPSPGKLEHDRWEREGQSGELKQHGFARTLPWRMAPPIAAAHDARVRVSLESNEQTRAQFPWEFAAELEFTLERARLHIAFELRNRDERALPFALGFHPYFRADDKTGAQIDTHATSAFDNVQKRVVPFPGFDWSAPELDLHLLDHRSSQAALALPDSPTIALRASPEFGLWVVWALADRPFICLEPWTAPGNALNTGERLMTLDDGAVYRGFIEIEAT